MMAEAAQQSAAVLVAEAVRPLQQSAVLMMAEAAQQSAAVLVAEIVRPLQQSSVLRVIEQVSRSFEHDLAWSADDLVAEIVRPLQQSSILRTAGHVEVAPPSHFPLTEADRRALHRAAVFIVVGILVILAMELAPEASSRFGTWLGISGGLTALIWYLIDQDKQP
jgi:hypothetical protein